MPSARDIDITDFTYDLPDDRIARYPLPERDAARQLDYRDGRISEAPFRSLPDRLPEGSLLIGNQTRVIHARLHFPLAGGNRPVEIFCLDPLAPHDYARSLGSTGAVRWKCLIGGNRRWKRGPLVLQLENLTLYAERGERLDNTFTVTFRWEADTPLSFGEVLAAAGTIPLPPYFGRAAEEIDCDRYQTVFARREGSVAAPTAGLHLTPEVLAGLQRRNIGWEAITLHVGAGTFKPVTTTTLSDHVMHREFFTVPVTLLQKIAWHLRPPAPGNEGAARPPLISVGTTSLRCLESLFYLGAQLVSGDRPRGIEIDQWVAEDERLGNVPAAEAFRALTHWAEESGMQSVSGYTRLLLAPPTQLRVADALITNFHQPRSTLLLLVAAIVGEDWRAIYDYALRHDFRFLSYGDSSLLWRRGGTQKNH